MNDNPQIIDGELFDPETGVLLVSKAQLAAVTIDDIAIDEEMMRAPRDLAYWHQQHAEAANSMLLEKHELERAEARAMLGVKANAQLTGKLTLPDGREVTKPNADDVEAAGKLDEDYHKAFLSYAQAEHKKRKLWGLCVAIEAKKDMTQSLAAKLRAQIQADPVIREQHRQARDYNNSND
jgi:hypothetical protein